MHFQTEQSMQGGQVLLGIHDSYQCHLEWWRSPGGQIGENFFFFFGAKTPGFSKLLLSF